jgi:hypothetical protein
MIVVMEKLKLNRDGCITVARQEWDYKAIARETLAPQCGMSPLAIWAMLHGCNSLTIDAGQQIWEDKASSARIFLEAGI